MKLQKTCPDKEVLINFLGGTLEESELVATEQHLAKCKPCLETMQNLESMHDTYSDLAKISIEDKLAKKSCDGSHHSEDQKTLDNLVVQLKKLGQGSSVSRNTKSSCPPGIVAESRTAEVRQFLLPPKQPDDLGYIEGYRIVRVLGAGSTGVVFQAIQESLNRKVALKILRPSLGEPAKARFVAEAQATAKLDHPNAISIYEVGEIDSLAFIAMQWVPGETLEDCLNRDSVLPLEDVAQLAQQLASALAEAHRHGLIHRDVKPANVWISETGDAKLLDFGLVRINNESPQLTCTGMIAGTPCFMSPEQSRGQALDSRTDLFSLGCVLYRALTGRLPFEGENALSTLQAIQRSQPTLPHALDPNIPSGFSNVVMQLLEKSPIRRPQSAEQFIETLSRPESAPRAKVEQTKDSQDGATNWSNWFFRVAGLLLMAFALGWAGYLYGPNVIRIVMNQGVIEIETEVDDVLVEVFQDGRRLRIVDLATEKSVVVSAGKYEIRPMGEDNSVRIENGNLVLSRGDSEIVRVVSQLRPVKAGKANDPRLENLVESNMPGVPLGESNSNLQRRQLAKNFMSEGLENDNYLVKSGAILGVFVEGVLGEFGESPPVNIPKPGSSLLPSIGYPVLVTGAGKISLPFVEPIQVDGKSVAQIEETVKKAFTSGDEPVLKSASRIIVTLIRRHDPSTSMANYKIGQGAILGIFVEGVLGEFDTAPPVNISSDESGYMPSMGYPIVVNEKGQISLPFVDPISVSGLSIMEAEGVVKKAFQGGKNPILKEQARILVTLMKPDRKQNTGQSSLQK